MADVITLNEIEEVKNLVGTNNTEDANGTLSQKSTAIFNFVTSRIGAPTDGGGTTQQGSVMAKLNALLNQNSSHGSQTYSTAGTYTWTCPAGVSQVFVLATGGSGGGGGGGYVYYYSGYDEATPGGGGGSGGISAIVYTILPVTAGSAYSLVVGAAGTAGSAGANMIRSSGSITTNVTAGTAGGAGGATKFGNLLTVNGGGGGAGGAAGGEYRGGETASAAGGKVGSLSTNKVFLVKEISGVSGNTGGKGTVSIGGYEDGETVYYYNIGTGGSSTVGKIINSGKGGNGGRAVSSSSIVNPTAGSKGSAGVIHVIW